MAVFLTLAALAFVSGLFGALWAKFDALEIECLQKSLNHKSRLALRLASSGAAAYLAAGGVWLFLALWLFAVSVLHLVFVPMLNKERKKDRYYISNSNRYDSFFIRHWKGNAGKVAYGLQVVVLIGAVVWVLLA